MSWNLIKPGGRISSSNLAAMLVPAATAFAARALVGGLAPAPAGTPGVRGGNVGGGGKAGKDRAGAALVFTAGALVAFLAPSAGAGAVPGGAGWAPIQAIADTRTSVA